MRIFDRESNYEHNQLEIFKPYQERKFLYMKSW